MSLQSTDRRGLRFALVAMTCLVLVVALLATTILPALRTQSSVEPVLEPGAAAEDRPGGVDAVIFGAAPSTWDPARAGDVGAASTLAQVYEGLTAFDADSEVQPALASGWDLSNDGRQLTFQLRPGIAFSDGSPITADDVVASWLRLIDPQSPGPLASLLSDVEGAAAYLAGEVGPDGVGLRADRDSVVVRFRRPASYFVAVTASPSLAVLPRATADGREGPALPERMVVSGAYLPVQQTESSIRLEANPNYWARPLALDVIELLTETGGESPVALFEGGRVDQIGVGSFDASWIRYDETLGPQLREADSFSVTYYGFDTMEPPFDDARVRRAFGQAVDWDRIVQLADADSNPATSLLPEGIPGRGSADFSPRFDPDRARRDLAAAGYPGGDGFPSVTLTTSGLIYDAAVAEELERELAVEVQLEVRPFPEYARLLDANPPGFWALSWIADYPQPQDFLGLLLETGSGSNEGSWSNTAFDAALEQAAGTEDEQEQEEFFAEAQRIVQREVPVLPVSYPQSWSLSRTGLLGAREGGIGFFRFAGLAWEDAP